MFIDFHLGALLYLRIENVTWPAGRHGDEAEPLFKLKTNIFTSRQDLDRCPAWEQDMNIFFPV